MIAGVIADLLLNDDLSFDLATHKELDGVIEVDVPNIFTGGMPEDVGLPAVVIDESGGNDWGTRDTQGAELLVDVKIYDEKKPSRKFLSDMAWKIRTLINRSTLQQNLAGSGFVNYGCQADPPAFLNDELGFPGYLIRTRVRVLKP